jgi:hypothetical protein
MKAALQNYQARMRRVLDYSSNGARLSRKSPSTQAHWPKLSTTSPHS